MWDADLKDFNGGEQLYIRNHEIPTGQNEGDEKSDVPGKMKWTT